MIIDFYTRGGSISGDVALKADVFYSADYDPSGKTIDFYNGDNQKIGSIDASDFVIDGMIEDVYLSGTVLTIVFNTDAGKQDIEVDLSDIFNPELYYTKQETDSAIGTAVSGLSGNVYTALSGISDDLNTLSGTCQDFITSGDVETQIEDKHYITSADTQDFVTSAQVETQISGKNYVTSGDVETQITGKNYITSAYCENFVTSADVETQITDKHYITSADTQDFVTSAQVETQISGKNYVTSGDVETQITDKHYITSAYCENFVTSGDVESMNYVTSAQVETQITGKGYATSGDVNTAINNLSGAVDTIIADEQLVTSQAYNELHSGLTEISAACANYVTSGQVESQITGKHYITSAYCENFVSSADVETQITGKGYLTSADTQNLVTSGQLATVEEVVSTAINDLQTKKVSSSDIKNIVKISQSDYNNLPSKDANTLYLIINV